MPSFLKKSSSGLKLLARHFEMRGRELQDFVGCLFERGHESTILPHSGREAPLQLDRHCESSQGKYGSASVLSTNLRKPCFDGGPREQIAENIDFAAQLVVGNRLDEMLRGDRRLAVEFPELRGGRARHAQRVAFGGHLADETRPTAPSSR